MVCPRKISFRMKSLKVFLDTEGKYDKSSTYEEGLAEIEKCEALLEDDSYHIILMHDHEATYAMVPDYYKIMLEHIMENGVTFVEPKFL